MSNSTRQNYNHETVIFRLSKSTDFFQSHLDLRFEDDFEIKS